jgi:hypothetical protein
MIHIGGVFIKLEGYVSRLNKEHRVPTVWGLVSDLEHSVQLPD